MNKELKWSKNVVIVDAAFLDEVAHRLTTHFEQVLNRALPKADVCQWLTCVALDGGLKPGKNEVQVVFVHRKEMKQMEHVAPSIFQDELDAKAFQSPLGEFTLLSVHPEDVVEMEHFVLDIATLAADAAEVERLMVVTNHPHTVEGMAAVADKTDGKTIFMCNMQPTEHPHLTPVVLGYSVLNALGIKADELG